MRSCQVTFHLLLSIQLKKDSKIILTNQTTALSLCLASIPQELAGSSPIGQLKILPPDMTLYEMVLDFIVLKRK